MAHPGRPKKCDPKIKNLKSNIYSNEFELAKATLNEFGIDAIDGDGRTSLINAVIEYKPTFIKWLIENGANINQQDRTGYSSLHFAGQNKLPDIAKYLLENGADPNIQDIHGNTPLWTAIFNSKETKDVVKLFIQYKANPDIQNKNKKTPREMYQAFYNTDISLLNQTN